MGGGPDGAVPPWPHRRVGVGASPGASLDQAGASLGAPGTAPGPLREASCAREELRRQSGAPCWVPGEPSAPSAWLLGLIDRTTSSAVERSKPHRRLTSCPTVRPLRAKGPRRRTPVCLCSRAWAAGPRHAVKGMGASRTSAQHLSRGTAGRSRPRRARTDALRSAWVRGVGGRTAPHHGLGEDRCGSDQHQHREGEKQDLGLNRAFRCVRTIEAAAPAAPRPDRLASAPGRPARARPLRQPR